MKVKLLEKKKQVQLCDLCNNLKLEKYTRLPNVLYNFLKY